MSWQVSKLTSKKSQEERAKSQEGGCSNPCRSGLRARPDSSWSGLRLDVPLRRSGLRARPDSRSTEFSPEPVIASPMKAGEAISTVGKLTSFQVSKCCLFFLLVTAVLGQATEWQVSPAADYRINWSGGTWHGVPEPAAEWYLADGLDWDTTAAGIYRNTGSDALTSGLSDGAQPGLAEGMQAGGQRALSFDGVNDYLTAGDDALFDFGTSDFMVEIWLRTTTTATLTSWGRHIIGKHDQGVMNAWAVGINKDSASGKLCFKASDATTYLWTVESHAAVNDGRWHHVVAARDYSNGATGIRLYLDGSLDSAGTQITGSISNNFALVLGADHGGNQGQFCGEIGLARIYRFTFTGSIDALVDSLYEARPDGSEAAPYPSAQGAVWQAAADDVLRLAPGYYLETLEIGQNLTLTAARTGFGFRPVFVGSGLPPAAGIVGLTADQGIAVSCCNFRGYAQTGGVGIEVIEAADPSLFEYITFDSCLVGITITGDADGDTVRCCDFLGWSMAGSKGVVLNDGLAADFYEVAVLGDLFHSIDIGLACGTWAMPACADNDFFEVGTAYIGCAPPGDDQWLPPRFRGTDFRPPMRALEGVGAWCSRIERGRLMRLFKRNR